MTATTRPSRAPAGNSRSRRQSSITVTITTHSDALSSIPLDSSPSTTHTPPIHHLDPVASLLLPADVNLTTSIVIKSYPSAPSRTNRLSCTTRPKTTGRMAYLSSSAPSQSDQHLADIPAVPAQPLDNTPAATMDQETSISQKMLSAVSGSILTSLLGVLHTCTLFHSTD
jgi:hypothetical protein